MRSVRVPSARKVVRRFVPVACVAVLSVIGTACGSDSKPANNTPGVTTPATDPPQAGGAGF